LIASIWHDVFNVNFIGRQPAQHHFLDHGSLDEPNTTLITVMVVSSLAGLIISMLFAQPLNALRLGEAKAKHLGINSSAVIRILFIIASLLTGLCVAVGGIIGFVGLIIPHILRSIIGSDYRILLISSFSWRKPVPDCLRHNRPNDYSTKRTSHRIITGMLGGSVFIIVLSRSKQKMIKTMIIKHISCYSIFFSNNRRNRHKAGYAEFIDNTLVTQHT
jgi:ABC-type Fe3+-siderophore transport system permease subunit